MTPVDDTSNSMAFQRALVERKGAAVPKLAHPHLRPRVERYYISFGKGREIDVWRCRLTTSPSVIKFSGGKELSRQPSIWGGQTASKLVKMSKLDEKYQTDGIFGLVPESILGFSAPSDQIDTSSSRSKRV